MGEYVKNILELLELNAQRFCSKVAFKDINEEITYSDLQNKAMSVGSGLINLNAKNKPIAIYLEKGINTLKSMFGIVYSGNFYVVIDSEMPIERINKIFSTLNPIAVITNNELLDNAKQLNVNDVFLIDELQNTTIDNKSLQKVRDLSIDTDPLYALYTSGSTGVPKGALLTHKNVLAYSEWVVNQFGINENTVFGNQTPFYFSMSVTDIYSTLRTGATLVIIPKQYFTFPIKLIEFMNTENINTIYWVPSAIGIVSNFKLFKYAKPEKLKTVLFAGEVMPTKQLNYWIQNLDSSVIYANLYGPTETTDICTFYKINREFDNAQSLPIGIHCDNCDVMIITENGEEAKNGEEGELYVRGSFLACGYYNNPEKTAAAFVQNPLNKAYPETVYKTGDLVKVNEFGEIIYIGRRDFQIKHMGYRIELGEIEAAANSVEGVGECACVYDVPNDKIIMFYSSMKVKEDELHNLLAQKLNTYLRPNKINKLVQLPHNQNGKIDRKKLQDMIGE